MSEDELASKIAPMGAESISQKHMNNLPNSIPLSNRVPKWNNPGCLMHKNEAVNWSFLKEMHVGEHIDVADSELRTNAHVMAERAKIKITFRQLDNSDCRIIRLS